MASTLILALGFILAILLKLYAAVALVQDKRLFSSAPKDIVDAGKSASRVQGSLDGCW